MDLIPRRTQFWLLAIGYTGALLITAAVLFNRYLVNLQDPASESGGMAAAGDVLLALFIGVLFLIPTAFLIMILAKSEAPYHSWSRCLLGLSLSAPICMTVVCFGQNYVTPALSWLCFFRILESPVAFVGMGISRLAARSGRTKKLASYALLIEGLTLALPAAAFAVILFIHLKGPATSVALTNFSPGSSLIGRLP